MDRQALADLGESAGGIAVGISLVYLAVQLRPDIRSLRTRNYARALDRISNTQAQVSQSRDFSSLFSMGVVDVSPLETRGRIQFTRRADDAFRSFEFMLHPSRNRSDSVEADRRWREFVAG